MTMEADPPSEISRIWNIPKMMDTVKHNTYTVYLCCYTVVESQNSKLKNDIHCWTTAWVNIPDSWGHGMIIILLWQWTCGATMKELLYVVFPMWSVLRLYKENQLEFSVSSLCGCGFSYFHCSPVSHRRWQKGYNWATLFLGNTNMRIWPSRFRQSQIWESKIWSWVSWDLDPRMTALLKASSNCKLQIHPLVREVVT
jgi:hypothetical protein